MVKTGHCTAVVDRPLELPVVGCY